MPTSVETAKGLLDIVIQVLVIVLPIVLSWFVRTYVRSSKIETEIAAVTRLSNAAIDYVENLDKNGQLILPPDVKKSGQKLKLAANWLESEMDRAGIKIGNDEAEKWIASEFQKRVGDIRPVAKIAELTKIAVDLVQELERNNVVTLAPDADRLPYLTGLAADWVVAQLARNGLNTSRDEALTWVRAEFLQRLQAKISETPTNDRLARLADGAVAFLEQLRANGQFAVPPGAVAADVEADIAVAWLLTEAVKQGLVVTSAQVADAAAAALQRNQMARAKLLAPPSGQA
jgi:hypothetical protein